MEYLSSTMNVLCVITKMLVIGRICNTWNMTILRIINMLLACIKTYTATRLYLG